MTRDFRTAVGVIAAHAVVGTLLVLATARVPAGAPPPAAPFSVTVSLPPLRVDAPPAALPKQARAEAAPVAARRARALASTPQHPAALLAAAPAEQAQPAVSAATPEPGAVESNATTATHPTATWAEPARSTVASPPARELVAARPDHDRCPSAGYPLPLKERGIEGTVWLRVRVSHDGAPADVLILRGSGWRLFDEAALQAARGCRFIPARRGDERLAGWVEFPMRFALSS